MSRSSLFFSAAEAESSLETAPQNEPHEVARAPADHTYSVLIASGKAEERKLFAELLGAAGYALTVVDNGEKALKRIYAQKFDLVVVSVVMPGIDGLELLQTVSGVMPAIPVIAIAAGRAKIDRVYLECATLLGAIATYTQPLNQKQFLQTVRKVLPQRPVRLVES